MRILHSYFTTNSRTTSYTIIPVGDIHIGARACDEERLRAVIDRIRKDKNCFWYGLGDYCDFINVRDPRHDPANLADWIGIRDLGDLVKTQYEYFMDLFKPIAHKCLGLVQGNHESTIQRFYERDIYSDIVSGIKKAGEFPADHTLALGYYGWSLLNFTRLEQRNTVKINLHHGFVGGKLAGAKALEMQRWLWSHDADVVIFGHSHNSSIQIEQSEGLNNAGDVILKKRFGLFAGSFLKSVNEDGPSTYSEVKGYLPMPSAGSEIIIKPGDFQHGHGGIPIRVITR